MNAPADDGGPSRSAGLLRSAGGVAVVALVAGLIVAGAWALTRGPIEDADRQARRQALALVLPPASFDNDPDADAVVVHAPAWLGTGDSRVRRARLAGVPVALVLDVVAPDGYGGPITLQVAVDAQDRVLGVHVTRHHETPGLGAAIDDRDGWIAGFVSRSLADPPAGAWRVARDGGAFDQLAGATVTPRAVVAAVARALAFVAAHGAQVRAAPAGATLRFDDAPDPLPPPGGPR